MIKIKHFLLGLFKPIQIIMQRLGRSEPKMNRDSVDLAMQLIRPGDILVSHEDQRLTSFFIKGEYDHAAIVGSNGKVIEAVGDYYIGNRNLGGVRAVDLEEWLFLMDKVAVIRPNFPDSHVNELAAANALSYIGRGYDYWFNFDKKRIYCSELIYLCYESESKSFLKGYIKDEILPQLYRDLCDDVNFKLVFEFVG